MNNERTNDKRIHSLIEIGTCVRRSKGKLIVWFAFGSDPSLVGTSKEVGIRCGRDLPLEVEVKKKIESLLTSFRRERQKSAKRSEMGSDEVYESTWFAYKHMYFLLEKFTPSKNKVPTLCTQNKLMALKSAFSKKGPSKIDPAYCYEMKLQTSVMSRLLEMKCELVIVLPEKPNAPRTLTAIVVAEKDATADISSKAHGIYRAKRLWVDGQTARFSLWHTALVSRLERYTYNPVDSSLIPDVPPIYNLCWASPRARIRFEVECHQSAEVLLEKKSIYEPTVNNFKLKYALIHVEVFGLLIGARGTFFEEFRRQFALPTSLRDDIVIIFDCRRNRRHTTLVSTAESLMSASAVEESLMSG
ncbi:hypothetical protein ANN_08557 [Periplaneta americana]|uniref:MADF domain-containing protein n=1 Tax=Periplaneta americana TaxID=6978 RepID=A0ABQ8T355_PERAM|nr:hypothetical protein ANN_08557 [Periplaneta americana]